MDKGLRTNGFSKLPNSRAPGATLDGSTHVALFSLRERFFRHVPRRGRRIERDSVISSKR
jgi:hypothetical protein